MLRLLPAVPDPPWRMTLFYSIPVRGRTGCFSRVQSLTHSNHHCSSHKVKGKGRKSAERQGSTVATALTYRASTEQQVTELALTALRNTGETTHRHQPCRPNFGCMGRLLSRSKSVWLTTQALRKKQAQSLPDKPIARESDLNLYRDCSWKLKRDSTLNSHNNPAKQGRQAPTCCWEAQQKSNFTFLSTRKFSEKHWQADFGLSWHKFSLKTEYTTCCFALLWLVSIYLTLELFKTISLL